MNSKASLALAIALLAVFPLAALAQEEPAAPAPQSRTEENLVAFKLLRMTQVLELTEEQTTKVYPAVIRLEKEKHAIMKDLNTEMRGLRELLRAEKPEEPKILAAVDNINKMRQMVRQKDEELEQFLRKNLTVAQYAKYTLFMVDFYRGLSESLDRARRFRDQNLRKKELERLPH
jgi:Spy/CpxP family protein refolding chaperone